MSNGAALARINHRPKKPLAIFLGRAVDFRESLVDHAALLLAAAELLFEPGVAAEHDAASSRVRDFYNMALGSEREIVVALKSTLITPLDAEDIWSLASAMTAVLRSFLHIAVSRAVMGDAVAWTSLAGDLAPANLLAARAIADVASGLTSRGAVDAFASKMRASDRDLRRMLREAHARLFRGARDANAVLKQLELLRHFLELRLRFRKTSTTVQGIYLKNC